MTAQVCLRPDCPNIDAAPVHVHRYAQTEPSVLRIEVEDLTRFSNAFLRRVADECERIITERVNDGAFS